MATPHIASPDVHVDIERQQVQMYFHGLESLAIQVTRHAVSVDGVHFTARPDVLGGPYLRVFEHEGHTYGMSMPGQIVKIVFADDGHPTGVEPGPRVFPKTARHHALWRRQLPDGSAVLDVLRTRVGDTPERILHSRVALTGDWTSWDVVAVGSDDSSPHGPNETEVLRPERRWEGAEEPVEPSHRGAAHARVNQLRDPAFFHEAGRTYALYAGGGESAIGIAELVL
ncbi:MAG: hypothetical protein HKN26_02745 [Acidimicrobiales bacterium]|nr:hypothetical protein [Acidimicrobiales bacterium]